MVKKNKKHLIVRGTKTDPDKRYERKLPDPKKRAIKKILK